MMPVTHNRRFTGEGGRDLEVDFEIAHFSSADLEVDVKDAWLFRDRDNVNAPRVELTDDERERFEEEVALLIWEYVE